MTVHEITGHGGARPGAGRPRKTATDDSLNDKLKREKIARERIRKRREELALAKELGELVPVEAFQERLAAIVKVTIGVFETLPDIMERDLGTDPEAVRELMDATRTELHRLLTERV